MTKLVPALLLTILCACSDSSNQKVDSGPSNPFEGFSSALYSDSGNWLCHPSLSVDENVCARNLDTTVVYADGTTEIEKHTTATDPAIDCFYVYPTVSADEGGNADFDEGFEEIFTTLNQAARYSAICRVFAPVYRQTTINSIIAGVEGDSGLAQSDVVESFKHYMANENNGRGFILIGHSQGSGRLAGIIEELIEPDEYLLQHMISAHLLGSTIRTPEGTDVVEGLQSISVCRTPDQTGCIVSYVSYRENDPFVASGEGRFGTPRDGASGVCVHPAAISGGSAKLDAYFPVDTNSLLQQFIIPRVDGPFSNPDLAEPITTPFYKMPGLLSGECTIGPTGISYLKVSVHADPTDPRADDFNGEMILQDWGLHLVDVTVGMGDLVRLGSMQAQAWLQDQ